MMCCVWSLARFFGPIYFTSGATSAFSGTENMASVREETGLSVYRKFLVELSLELSRKDLETLKYAAVDFIPLGRTENMGSGLQFFDALEQDMRIGPRNLTLLQDMFKTIFRVDLAQRIQGFSNERAKFETDGNPNKIVSD